jgi:hypothetical protein
MFKKSAPEALQPPAWWNLEHRIQIVSAVCVLVTFAVFEICDDLSNFGYLLWRGFVIELKLAVIKHDLG